jgi:hypothetical protein
MSRQLIPYTWHDRQPGICYLVCLAQDGLCYPAAAQHLSGRSQVVKALLQRPGYVVFYGASSFAVQVEIHL